MNIVNDFRDHLFTDKNKPSKITVKNYVSDVRKFIQWFETTYSSTFDPALLTPAVITAFQKELQKNAEDSNVATRSAKRYNSSLRKFCRFLSVSGAIKANPFDALATAQQAPADPWQMKAFKNFLVAQGASKLTIKNYTLDIQQFLAWLEKVTEAAGAAEDAKYLLIDNIAVQQYRDRLLAEARFSPTSINRKLSSLRRYQNWLSERGLITIEPTIEKEETVLVETPIAVIEEAQIPLTALKDLPTEISEEENREYSRFAPIRLFQKTKKALNKAADKTIFDPIAGSIEAVQYSLWKKSGKQVFTPVNSFLNKTGNKIQDNKLEKIQGKALSTITSFSSRAMFIVSSVTRVKTTPKPYSVRNISKSFYAPLSISLTHLPWQQRIVHHIRYTRPAWYQKYHAWPISHHIHFAILMFAMAICGYATYQSAVEPPGSSSTALASQSMAPPRTLAFQGRLLDKTNTPITAETKLRFAVYNSPSASGSAMLWQEVQDIKPNQNGYFTAQLGKRATLSQQIFTDNPSVYVGIAVGNESELQPRQQLATTGLASNAKSLQGLKPITDTDETQNVILALDSSGDLTIGGSASPTFQATGGQFTLSGQSLLLATNPGSNGNIELTPDGSGIIDMQSAIGNTTNNVGAAGVAGAVEVNDLLAVIATSSGQSAFTVKQNSTGDIISGFNNEIAKFRVDATGNGMFAGNLQVNGNTIATNATTFGIANTNVINLSIGTNASALSLGGKTGITTINNSMEVRSNATVYGQLSVNSTINANGGIVVGPGHVFTLSDFTPGAIPFIGTGKQLTQDAASFAWEPVGKSFKVAGSICVKATVGACAGSTAGTIYAANTTVQAADLAENYISAQQLEPGDVVIPESLGNNLAIVKSTASYQPQVIGIVSTKPGFTLNSDAQPDAEHPNVYPLALQGRVPVKVSSMNGAIKAGDPLTSSTIPGVAMKATKPGQIIAKALEDYTNADPNAIGKVMSFVNISYQIPQSSLTKDGDLNLALAAGNPTVAETGKTLADTTPFAAVNTIKAQIIDAAEVTTSTLKVTSDQIFVNGQHLSDYIAGIVKDVSSTNNTPSATDQIVNTLNLVASGSASLADIEPKATASASTASAATASAGTMKTSDVASTAALVDTITTSFATPSAAPTIAIPAPSITEAPTASQTAELEKELDQLVSGGTTTFIETIVAPEDLDLETIDSKDVQISNTLSVVGRTTLSDVGITGKVTIGLMNIEGLNASGNATINTSSGPLKFQSDGFNGVDFMNGKVAIAPNGDLEVNGNAFFAKDVTVKGKLAANIIAPVPGSDLTVENNKGKSVVKVTQDGDVEASGSGQFANINIVRGVQADTSATETKTDGSAGKGIIKAKQKERTIYTPYVTKQSLIYVTATSDTQKTSLYVARQTASEDGKGSFTVQISNNVSKDITFNWWIVN